MESSLGTVMIKIRDNFSQIIVISLIFILIGVGVSLILPKQYRAEAQLVVIQKANPEVDSYTAQRSVEATVDLLVNLAYTDSFFANFSKDNVDIKNRFPQTIKERRRAFERDILITSEGGGFIEIQTYDSSSELALAQSQSVVKELVASAESILGDTADIQVVNQPALYDGIGRPNLLLNLIGSAILGLVVAFGYVLLKKDTALVVYDFGIDPEEPDGIYPFPPTDSEIEQERDIDSSSNDETGVQRF